MSTVIFKELAAPPINRREILRYMGVRESSAEIEALIDRSISLCENKLTYKVCFAEHSLKIDGDICQIACTSVQSRDLAKCLSKCDKAVIFAATVGIDLDRLILRYGKSEPSVSVCLQAIGAERIEALCDALCAYLSEIYSSEGKRLRPRFSAGYGDLPLSFQRVIFTALDCPRRIGLTLNDSLMMSPTKSVTAIVGIY